MDTETETKNKTPIYTKRAIDKYRAANKDKINAQRKLKLQDPVEQEKRREYMRTYMKEYYKRKKMVTPETKETLDVKIIEKYS